MKINIITLFPEFFKSPIETSLLQKAIQNQLIHIELIQLRNYAMNDYGKIDDEPYGGGNGMLLMVEPIAKAIEAIQEKEKSYIVLLSPRGFTYKQHMAQELLSLDKKKYDSLTLICGHYEGIDERIAEFYADVSISIGDFILSGGEPAALILLDSIARLTPGFMGNPESIIDESFRSENYIEYPQYTRPATYKDKKVPEVLLSGNHKLIKEYREKKAKIAYTKFKQNSNC